ncbi:hypothetical protein SEA_DRYAD_7 [Streptomyces phage Dryad]|nr:hypothetical protein SEA_DRYAD_7 [Streptomyces phage Dryad]
MADAHLSVGVEVELRPDENTSRWLESLGWIRPEAPSQESVSTELEEEEDGDWDPAEMLGGVTLSGLAEELKPVPAVEIPPARPLRTERAQAMGGAEAMRYRAQHLRTRLRGELADEGAQRDLDELLRMCDVDMKRVFGPDCDC